MTKELDSEELQKRIDATHPVLDNAPEGSTKADSLAMEMIHVRHSKRDLVNLVRYLILNAKENTIPFRP